MRIELHVVKVQRMRRRAVDQRRRRGAAPLPGVQQQAAGGAGGVAGGDGLEDWHHRFAGAGQHDAEQVDEGFARQRDGCGRDVLPGKARGKAGDGLGKAGHGLSPAAFLRKPLGCAILRIVNSLSEFIGNVAAAAPRAAQIGRPANATVILRAGVSSFSVQ
ncbi:MAG: hypothetical protein V9G23_06165 [Giesbergeria sp.]